MGACEPETLRRDLAVWEVGRVVAEGCGRNGGNTREGCNLKCVKSVLCFHLLSLRRLC